MVSKAYRTKKYPLTSMEMVGEHIIFVYFDNPPVNASNAERGIMWDELFSYISDDDDIRCVVISGQDAEYKGKHYFCAGADVKQWHEHDQGVDAVERKVRPMIFPREARQTEVLYNLGKPSIAMVNGTCVGVGADWAITCDITIASDDAQIGWVYVKRGLIPYEGGAWLLTRRTSLNNALELVTTGRIIDAQEAYRMGIFNKVVPHVQLRDVTLELARWYAEEGPPLAIGACRALVYQGLHTPFSEHFKSIELAASAIAPDRIESMAAWVEKRKPRFQGKGNPK